MRVFVTGASGWIGSAVVPELLAAGHEVVGLARSDASAAAVAALGAGVHRGDLADLDSLRTGAAGADGVVHLGYNHDFSDIEGAAATDLQAVEALGSVLEGNGRPLVVASGTPGAAAGRVATEQDLPVADAHPRMAGALATLALADRGVRSVVVRFPPTVHGEGDRHGFVARLVAIARERGVSGCIDDGANRWPAVHRLDAGSAVRLALDSAPAGSVVHAVAEEGIPTRTIADAIGRGLGVPVVSIDAADAGAHFGWLARFFGADVPASNDLTRRLLGWGPVHQGLVADLDAGYYFAGA